MSSYQMLRPEAMLRLLAGTIISLKVDSFNKDLKLQVPKTRLIVQLPKGVPGRSGSGVPVTDLVLHLARW